MSDDIRDDLDFRADFDEKDGQIKDKIGSNDSEAESISFYNPIRSGVSLNGSGNFVRFPNGTIDNTVDYTWYLDITFEDPATDSGFMSVGNDQRPRIVDGFFGKAGGNNRLLSQISAGAAANATANIITGVNGSKTERWIIFVSWDKSALKHTTVAYSKLGAKFFLESTVASDPPLDDSIVIGRNVSGTSFVQAEVFEFGVQNGAARNLTDMKNTANNLLFHTNLTNQLLLLDT